MNDRHIEELLQRAWQPEPPEGMQDRVLTRACRELPGKRRFDWRWMLGWKPALAAVGIAIVIFTHAEDSRRVTRMTAMIGGPAARTCVPSADYLRLRRELSEALAKVPSDRPEDRQKKDGRL